jgi:hypothetical protein
MAQSEAKRSTDTRETSPERDPIQSGGAGDASTPNADRISQRAYERFRARGGEHGHDQEDWFEAERELSQGPDRDERTVAGDVDARRLEPRDPDESER